MLDQDQQRVADLKQGYFAVHAGPGSGKSTTLLHRTANLNGNALCVTFTSEAAKSLKTRSGILFPWMDTSCFSTLHSLALKFAYDYAADFPFKLASNPLAIDGAAARAVYDATNNKINYQAFTSWVSLQKRRRISPAAAVLEAEATGIKLDSAIAYKKYQYSLRSQGLMDFDDLIYYMVEVLETRPDVRSMNQYEYLMMDEAQDACELEWELLRLVSQRHKNVMAVGDAGQAIYSFRGGVPELFLHMEEIFPDVQKMYLGNNYRSTRRIVDMVKKSAPFEDISQHFVAVSTEEGLQPTVTPYSTDYMEGEGVVKKVIEYGPDTCAVLCRTNIGLRAVEEACLNEGIKYHILGNSGFWEAPEVQAVLSYVRCCAGLTDYAIKSALRTPFWPSKYVKKKQVIEDIEKYNGTAWEALRYNKALDSFRNFLSGIQKYRYLQPSEVVSSIIRDLKAVEMYAEEENVNPDRNPIANLKELVRVAGKYTDLKDFLDFIRRIQYVSKTKSGVCLSTIHQAKGKEWPNVFVVGANEGTLPHAKSDNLEEEKNCFYVAVSRAEKTLHLSFYETPSRFLKPFMEIQEEQLKTAVKEYGHDSVLEAFYVLKPFMNINEEQP